MNSPPTYTPRQLRDLAPLEEPETTKQIGREAADLIDALAAETRNLRAELDRTKSDLHVALADLVAVYDAEAAGVAQQVTKPERIAAARAVLATYS